MNNFREENLIKKTKKAAGFFIKNAANISYLTGVLFPYPESFPFRPGLLIVPSKKVRLLVLPLEWKGQPEAAGWEGETVYYSINDGKPDESFIRVALEYLKKANISLDSLALDLQSWTANEFSLLQKMAGDCALIDCSETLSLLRMIKDDEELGKLREAAVIGDRGIIGALNHVEGTIGSSYYTASEFLERVRVHAIEFGSHGIGFLNLSQGANNRFWYSPIEDFRLIEEGDLLGVDYSHQFSGYWNQCSRMLSVGEPDADCKQSYRNNLCLMKYAIERIRPQQKISDFCHQISQKADEMDVNLLAAGGFGSGVGLSEVEWPLVTFDNHNPFLPGMVLTLNLAAADRRGMIFRSVETIVINESGAERISNFKTWDEMYILDGVRSNH